MNDNGKGYPGVQIDSSVVLDFECTGANNTPVIDEAVSVAVTDLGGNVLYSSLIQPTRPIPAESTEIHGISDADVKDAPTFKVIASDMAKVIDGRRVWIYNAAYDFRIWIQSAWLRGFVAPPLDAKCAMLEYARLFGAMDSNGEWKWHKLGAAYEMQFGDVLPAHDAVHDCIMTAGLVRKMLSGYEFKTSLDEPFDVRLTQLQPAKTYKGDTYARFTTAGGQTVNVFKHQYPMLRERGIPVQDWLGMLMDRRINPDGPHILHTPVYAKIGFKDGFAELRDADVLPTR